MEKTSVIRPDLTSPGAYLISSLCTMSWSSVTSGKWPSWSVSKCSRSWRHRLRNPRVRPCEPLCELLPGGDSVPLTGEGFRAVFEDFFGSVEDEGKSRIKGWRRYRRSARTHLPAERTVYGGFQRSRKWRLLDKVLLRLAS